MENSRLSVFILVLAFLIYKGFQWYIFLDYNLHLYNSYPGLCKVIKTPGLGSEDLQVTSDGLAFITSGISFSQMPPEFDIYRKEKGSKGRMLLYNFNDPKREAIELKIKSTNTFSTSDFRPHGISILEDPQKREHLIYLINHPFLKPDTVEKFKFKPDTNELIHLKTFQSEALITANDLAIVEEDKFYITNFLFFKTKLMVYIEQLLQLPLCNILFFNGTDFEVAASTLNSPNGIVISKDNLRVYVAMPNEKSIRVFSVEDSTLNQVQNIKVHTCPDNLNLSPDDQTLFVGAHPIVHKAIRFMHHPWDQSPSLVLSLPLKDGEVQTEEGRQLFYDNGGLIKASTVADVYKDKLIIGSLLDTLVVCDNNSQ